jgi:hypothetical protein
LIFLDLIFMFCHLDKILQFAHRHRAGPRDI